MFFMGTRATREFKINWMLNRINKGNEVGVLIEKKKIVALFCIDLASSPKTANEILRDLELAGKIVIKDGIIWTPDHLKEEEEALKLNPSEQKE